MASPTKKELQRAANIYILSAFILAGASALLFPVLEGSTAVVVFLFLRLGLAVLFVVGCMRYAQSKGHSPWLGLLGLLTCIGLLILVLLPDKWRDGAPSVSPTNYPRPPQA